MMATPISGRKGRLYADSSTAADGSAKPVANLNSWSISAGHRPHGSHVVRDTIRRRTSPALRDASGDFGGFHDTDGELYNMPPTARPASSTCTRRPTRRTKYWYGTATFDITTNGTVGGAVEVSGSWAASFFRHSRRLTRSHHHMPFAVTTPAGHVVRLDDVPLSDLTNIAKEAELDTWAKLLTEPLRDGAAAEAVYRYCCDTTGDTPPGEDHPEACCRCVQLG
jgi:hypothetical protein